MNTELDCLDGYDHDFRDYSSITDGETALKVRKCVVCDLKRMRVENEKLQDNSKR